MGRADPAADPRHLLTSITSGTIIVADPDASVARVA